MELDFNRQWLIHKFEEIRRRTLNVLEQLNDEQVNWQPHESSFSISTLVRHIEGNIKERVAKGILRHDIQRNREEELTQIFVSRDDLMRIVIDRLQFVIDTIHSMSTEAFEETQSVRGNDKSNLEILHQCATHYSEHMGQIFYIAKQNLQEKYKSTSI
ncbi:hypothetical protein JCM10914A_02040 [Paenibacillus sp. JCM 10914]|uniref:DinB family protein n=1 Tax=Paenibacillus sp. JCM 10914 TaxID=1236974 RepID=UPI0003CC8C8F|nr:DinB family protein [Paenibacillus sp. JCM 10914]GAE06865.1 hypothetical protein JCM10914_3052 [Paenibacillus sp. JCM 10914]